MNEKDTLIPYIQAQLQGGVDSEAVKQQLIGSGWGEAIVNEAIRDVTEQQQVQSPIAAGATTNVVASEAYGVMEAIKDAYRALEINALGVIAMLGIGFVATVVAVVLAVVAGIGTVFMVIASSGSGSSQPFVMLLLMFLLYLIVFSFVSAFTQALIGLAVNDGAEGRKSNIKNVVLTAAKRSLRVLVATVLCALVATGPALLALILGLTLAAAAPGLAMISYLLAIVAIIAGPLIALRLLLMPVVALFETDLALTSLFGRTRQLMKNGGSWFIVKFILVVMAAVIVLSVVLPSESELEDASMLSSLMVGIIAAVFATFYSAVLVVFYRNRKAVRG